MKKINWNRDFTTKAVYVFLVALALIVVIMCFLNLNGILSVLGSILAILSPFFWGFVIAYILNRPIMFFETKVFSFKNAKKPMPKLSHYLSIVIVTILFFALLAGIIWIIVPQLIESISTLLKEIPGYFDTAMAWLQNFVNSLGLNTGSGDMIFNASGIQGALINYLRDLLPDLASTGVNLTVGILGGIMNMFLAFIASLYFMASKEKFILQFKKLLFALFPKSFSSGTVRILRKTHVIFSSFITGKLLIALIMGVLNFIVLSIVGIAYAPLLSVIMGLFSLIPFFGPFIGAIPCVLLLLMVNPMDALWFIIITVILEQVNGQLLTPRIIGNSLGLGAFWVMFAIIVGGGIGGILGMIIGVPIFAIIYTLIREYSNMRLQKKGLSTDPLDYRSEKNK